jgi:hypothetical protein
MKIYKIGSCVHFNSYQGIITAVCIRGLNIQYEISYFVGADYKQIWLTEYEFSIENTNKFKIGFK